MPIPALLSPIFFLLAPAGVSAALLEAPTRKTALVLEVGSCEYESPEGSFLERRRTGAWHGSSMLYVKHVSCSRSSGTIFGGATVPPIGATASLERDAAGLHSAAGPVLERLPRGSKVRILTYLPTPNAYSFRLFAVVQRR